MTAGAPLPRVAAETGFFDAHHPPDAAILKACVHCGFCLPTCPTYRLWGREMDSPRGRIYLMRLGLDGEIPLDSTVAGHFDACLGCLACVTACPSGVHYGRLIEATRSQVERQRRRRPGERLLRRLVLGLFPHPRRLRVVAALAWAYQRLRLGSLARRVGLFRRLPAGLRAAEELLPEVRLRDSLQRLTPGPPPTGAPVARVGLVTGCVQAVFFPGVNRAAQRVLTAEGCRVVVPQRQACCGALALHAGEEQAAFATARRLIAAFDGSGVDRVVVTAAGCGSTLKDYGYLLRDDPEWAGRAAAFAAKVRDVTEFLAEVPPRSVRHPITVRAAYADACHLAHGQGVRSQPRRLLEAIPGLTLAEPEDAEICCGSAGIYNLVKAEAAGELGRRKAAAILGVEPGVIVTANPGCALQIRRHLRPGARPTPILHPIELIDASIRGVTPPGL